jgi:hypothetical protein
MIIEELERLPNWQAIAVDNQTGHAIAIIRVNETPYRLYNGNSITTPYGNEIQHPDSGNIFFLNEVRQMFTTRKLSILKGFLPDQSGTVSS